MKSTFVASLMLLSMGQATHAQYIYWNNHYAEIEEGSAAGSKLFLDTIQGNFAAIGGSWDGANTGFEMRNVNNEGIDLGEVYVAGPEPSSGGYGFGNQFFAKPLDGGYIYCSTAIIPDCEYSETAILHKITADSTTDWYKKFDEWHADCSSWSGSNLVKVMPDGRIFLSSYHYFDADTTTTATWDYNGYRFTTLDADGNILSDSLHILEDDFDFHFVNGVVLNDSIVLLAGGVSFIPFYEPDGELLLIKVNVNDGSFGENYSFPLNENLGCGGWPVTSLRPDGKVNVFYHYCEDEDGNDWSIFTPHLMLFDPVEMQPVWDQSYFLPEWDIQAEGVQAFASKATSDGGTFSTISLEGEGFLPKHFLLKTQASGELDWYHEYFPPIATFPYWNYLFDIIEVPDSSGFVITGEISDEEYVPHHWMFHIDPCGDPMWNDCGVGVGETNAGYTFLIHPNPTSSVLNVQGVDVIHSISFKDISGRTVLRHQVNSKSSTLNVSDVSPGLYLLEADFGNGRVSAQRVVVERP